MKARITDKETLRSISSANIRSYLQHRGGVKLYDMDTAASVWQYANEELLVPSSSLLSDYAIRISQVLCQIESIESRSQVSIFDDISRISYDTIRIRNVSQETKHGTLSLDKSVDFVLHTKEMLLAAACHASTGKTHYPSKKPQEAENFLKTVHFDKTEQGSFSLILLSPVPPPLTPLQRPLFADETLFLDNEEQFSDRVIPTLSSGLSALDKAASLASSDFDTNHFASAVVHGVTTNLCDAVANMYNKLSPDFIEVSIQFSANRTRKLEPSKTRFAPELIPIIQRASAILKSSEPEEETTVRGVITKLGSEEPKESGEVIVRDILSMKPRNITLRLSGDSYKKAWDAHFNKKVVEIQGALSKEGRGLYLVSPFPLKILDMDEN